MCGKCSVFNPLLLDESSFYSSEPGVDREGGQVPFVLVGTMASIENATLLLEYRLNHLKVGFAFYVFSKNDHFVFY